MKRFPKLIVALLLVAMVVGIFAAIPASAADYEALRLKRSMLTAGHYTSKAMDGEIVQHSANKNYNEEIGCLVDNDNKGAYWSKPYKFSDLVDNGGSTVPVILIDLSSFNEGAGVAVSAFDLRLRSALDCRPLHIVLQATLSANSNEWTTVADKKFTIGDWDINPKQRVEFNEVTAFKFRILAYDIADADPAADEYNDYIVCKGDETRFTLSEIDLLTAKEGGSSSGGSSSGGSSSGDSSSGSTGSTRPGGIQVPTRPAATTATQPATKAPTQPTTPAATTGSQNATKAPTQPTAPAATTGGNQTTTQAPTTNVTTTEPTGTTPSEPTVDPSAPTETVDPSAPTDVTEPAATDATEPEATTDATEPEATTGATEPEATTPTTDTTGEETPDNTTTIIIIAIAAAALIAAAAIIIIIKKKKNG